jgi:predicted RNA-binding Zn-ribbon protein involved in translation (DUF1610 family)
MRLGFLVGGIVLIVVAGLWIVGAQATVNAQVQSCDQQSGGLGSCTGSISGGGWGIFGILIVIGLVLVAVSFTKPPSRVVATLVCRRCRTVVSNPPPAICPQCGLEGVFYGQARVDATPAVTPAIGPTRVCLGCGTVLPSPVPRFCPHCGKAVPP